jgi:hypothetical protein
MDRAQAEVSRRLRVPLTEFAGQDERPLVAVERRLRGAGGEGVRHAVERVGLCRAIADVTEDVQRAAVALIASR